MTVSIAKYELIMGYMEVLRDFDDFTDGYPYLLDLESKQLWLTKSIDHLLDLPKNNTTFPFYSTEEWMSIIHPKDRSKLYTSLNMLSADQKERVAHNKSLRVKSKGSDTYLTLHTKGTFKNIRDRYPFIIGHFSFYGSALLPAEKPLISERIQVIQDLFFHMDEFVYMTDMDTNELVYLNQAGLKSYGISSLEELSERKCYDLLQNNSTICSFCTNENLEPLQYTEWKIFNPEIKKYFLLKDTMIQDGDKKYRLEIAIDVTENKADHIAAESFRNLEKVANEGVRHALSEASPDDAIQSLLEYLGKALKGERTYIFEKNEQGNDDNTYEWVASGVEPQINNLQAVPSKVCHLWYSTFESGKHISITDLEEIRETDPEMYRVLAPQGIHSIVVVPIYMDGDIIGFYGVDNPPIDTLDYAYSLLHLIGHFITSGLKRRSLVRQLHDLGYQDPFTKFGNRLAMNEYLTSVDPGKSMGILYCDITGLKATNDNFGHEAGDQLILNACACLKEAFPKEKLFRIGGDELLVLCPGIAKDVLTEKTELLREKLKEKSVVLAIGSEYRDDLYHCKIAEVIKIAEQYMYEDKSRYYKENGLERRRR